MPVSVVAALMIITTVLLSACQQQQVASIEDKGTQYYGRDAMARMAAAPTGNPYGNSLSFNFGSSTYQSASLDTISSAPLTSPSSSSPVVASDAIKPLTAAPVTFHNASPATMAMASGWHWPAQGRVVEKFGVQATGIANEGITIAANDGAPITSAAGGEVAYVGNNLRDYGNMVIIRHPGGELTSYAHAREILVSKGDKVVQGDVLGYVGQTGNAKAPQLHFAMREGTAAVDPLSKLPSQMASR